MELLAEKEPLSYTDIMTLLQITNTGRLNYHLKVLGNLLSKDDSGRYHLTNEGKQAANLLRTFPERAPPEKNLTPVKVAAAVVLALVGVLLISAFVTALLAVGGPTTMSTEAHVGMSTQTIPENTTVYLAGWALTAPALNMAWNAANPVRLFVLNQTQYDTLLPSQSSGAQTLPAPANLTGTPSSWVRDFDGSAGNLTLSLPQGQYYFYAWSSSANLLISFGLSQTQTQSAGTGFSPLLLLYSSVFGALGALLLIVSWSILTRRIWR